MATQAKKAFGKIHGIPSSGGGDWKSKVFLKKNRGSRTPGKTKGIRASSLQRWMCKHNRSWKHPLYGQVMASLGNRTKKG